MSSGGLSSSGRPFPRLQEARASPLPGDCQLNFLFLYYLAVLAPFRPPGPPPLALLIPSLSVDIDGTLCYNSTAQFSIILEAAWFGVNYPIIILDNI